MEPPNGNAENTTDEELARLRAAYEAALQTYIEASAAISRQLADTVLPSDADFKHEDDAAKALEAARRAFWSALR